MKIRYMVNLALQQKQKKNCFKHEEPGKKNFRKHY